MKKRLYLQILLVVSVFFLTTSGYSQHDTINGVQKLRQLINEGKIAAATLELESQLNTFRSKKKYDTLPYYVEFVGSYTLANNDWNTALKRAKAFVEELKKHQDPGISKQALKELAWIYSETGKPEKAFEALQEAYRFAEAQTEEKGATKADIQYNLGYYASAMGDYPLSKIHYQRANRLVKSSNKVDHVFSQQINNALGGLMWREGKMDSCNYYFNQSLEALTKTDDTPINTYYRPALVKMNMAVVSNILGKNHEAIQYSESAITNFQKYIDKEVDEQLRMAARGNQLVAIDNLGVFYNAIGEFKKAEEIITYSYLQKKKDKNDNDPNVVISKIILAQAKLNTRDLEGAERLLKDAIRQIEEGLVVQFYWHAAALTTLAKVYEQKGEITQAARFFDRGELLYREVLQGNYNNEYLLELSTMALFYATNGEQERAVNLAQELQQVTTTGSFKNTIQEQKGLITLAEIYYDLKDYENALKFSEAASEFKVEAVLKNPIDSIFVQYSRPRSLLLNAKAKYNLETKHDKAFLRMLSNQIDDGLEILEQRKRIISSYEDYSLLIEENHDLFSFAKKLRLELYRITGDESYLNDAIALHESAIYNRIRSRLNLRNTIAFKNIPESVLDRERSLKSALSSSLTSETANFSTFLDTQRAWNAFLDSLKTSYPNYYTMRYGTLEESIASRYDDIPGNTTVVRYVYVEDSLYAFVITPSEKRMIQLNDRNIAEDILKLQEATFEIAAVSQPLNRLYNTVWKPIEAHVTTENVVIIPDGPLFNLSFEMLTPQSIVTFKELTDNSLLARHNISYNFSLLMLGTSEEPMLFKNEFIAFVPEFTGKMKDDYKMAITDSVTLDKSYLTLLPQPFSLEVAEKYARVFDGTSYLNENASKQLFLTSASENKIIHIGTHAESNNVSPELSRLIFAKDLSSDASVDNNSLYSYEIYNYDLSSDLAILTACETGKPTYQAGEGMISLAHAFNYAGSNSILTSLWKVDEQSSAAIISSFYDHLAEGIPKDKALRLAKLDYLSTAEGRVASPQYWAGLVLMGDTTPLEINSTSPLWYWLIGIVVIAVLLFFVFRKRA
ncbi:MAG: CHAT domain-containing protein [Flavobacteriales bacterium]|jgi:CHAT domain-containing protein|nr:CHAT domain-containing protein [Flavobacteriales bacterium]